MCIRDRDVIMEALEGGEIVRLADLGTFQIGLSVRGAETEDTYDVSMIRKAPVSYTHLDVYKRQAISIILQIIQIKIMFLLFQIQCR